VFEKEGQGVFVPYEEFQRLWKKAMDRPEAPPSISGVSTALYEGRIEGDLAILQATLEVIASADGESAVPVGLGDAALGEALLDGKPAILLSDAGGRKVVVRGRGAHALKVMLVAPVLPKDGDRTVAFPSAGAPVSRLSFTVPGEGVKVVVDPNLATTRSDAGSGTTLVQAYVGAAKEVRLTWRPRPVEAAGVAAVLQAQVDTLHTVGEQTVATHFYAGLTVLRAGMKSFRFRVPASERVVRLEGADIRSWDEAEIAGGLREVRVELHAEVQGSYELRAELERPRAPGEATADLPAVLFEGVSRESGVVGVVVQEPVRVRPAAAEGLYRIRPADLEKWMVDRGPVLAYRYAGRPRRLSLAVETEAPDVTVFERTLLDLAPGAATLRAAFDVTVERAGLFQVAVGVPDGWSLESAMAGGDKGGMRPVDARIEGEGAARRVLLDLGTRRIGAFPVALTLRRPFDAGDAETSLELPVLLPQGAARTRGVVGVSADESLDVRSGGVKGFVPADPAEIATARLPAVPAPEGPRPVLLGFRHAGEERSGSLAILRRKPLVTSETVTLAGVEEDRLRVRHAVKFLVRYAGVDVFRVSLPKEVADRAQLSAPGLKERKKEPDPADAARVLLTATLQSPALGEIVVAIDYDLPQEPLAVGGSRTLAVPVPAVRGVEREVGWYAVTRDPSLNVEGQAKGLTYADAREVPPFGGAADAFLAFRFLSHPHSLSLAVTKHQPVKIREAVVNALALDTLIGGGEVALTEARMDVQVNGLQYLRIELPAEAEIESAEVDGKPVSPRKEAGVLLLPAPAGRGRDDRFPVRIVYRESAAGAAGKWFSARLVAPKAPQAMVQGTAWTLWVPADATFFSGGGNLRPAERGTVFDAILSDVAACFGAPSAAGQPTSQGGALPPRVTLETGGRTPWSFQRTGEDAMLQARFVPWIAVGVLAGIAALLAFAAAWLLARRGAPLLVPAFAAAALSLLAYPAAAPGLRPALAMVGVAGAVLAVLAAVRGAWRATSEARGWKRVPDAPAPAPIPTAEPEPPTEPVPPTNEEPPK
jgi:hypothetical protein